MLPPMNQLGSVQTIHVRRRTSGTLDMLINKAGCDFLTPLLDVNSWEAKEFFDVNFWSVLAVTQALALMLIKAKGVIVNHSSIVWNLFIPWGGIYSTSKAAVKQLSEILRIELEPLGVRVVTVLIGAVDTPIFANSHPDAFAMPTWALEMVTNGTRGLAEFRRYYANKS